MGVTADYEPIEPNLFFTTGITEVHAIFDYSDMSSDYTWERVWNLNDNEVARIAEVWAGPEAGVFDYFINNSDRPLPTGDWVLEIYVEGKPYSLGVFIIGRQSKLHLTPRGLNRKLPTFEVVYDFWEG